MIRRALVAVGYAACGLVAVVLISAGVLAWRLSTGPVSLGPLMPVVDLALGAMTGSLDVSVDDAVLTWRRSDRILDVRLVDAEARSPEEQIVARVPELSVALKTDALLSGVISPTEIEIVRPDVRLVRTADTGSVMTEKSDESSGPALSSVMSFLAEMSGSDGQMRELSRIRVVDGAVSVEDRLLGLSWNGSIRNTALWREPSGIRAKGFLSLTSDSDQAELAFAGDYDAEGQTLSAGISFDQVRPSAFALLGSWFGNLAAIDLPVRGTANLLAEGDGRISKVGFDVLGGAGHLALPVPLAQELGILDAAQRLAARGLQLSGTYKNEGMALAIDQLEIDLEPGQTVYLPAPLDHKMPLLSVQGQGRYLGDQQRVEMESLELNLDGPVIGATATATGLFGNLAAEARITASDVRTNDLARYWPASVAVNARDWCTTKLADGGITEATVNLAAAMTDKGVELTSVSGTMDVKGLTVDYLPPMPKARGASGVATFDMNSFSVKIAGGEAEGVSVRGGTARLYDFGKPQEMADIDLSIEGPIPKVLALIDHPPLGYVKSMGLTPDQAGGVASGRVRLQFPLMADLPLERLRVSADIKLDKVSVTKIALGADVTNGRLTIKLDEKGMDVKGPIDIENAPAVIEWRENFETGAPFDTRLIVQIADADVSLLRALKLKDAPLIEDRVSGRLGVDIRYVAYPSGEDDVEINADGTRASLAFPYFGWKKPVGNPANGVFKAKMRNGRLTEISSFKLSGPNLSIQGSGRFTDGGELKSVSVDAIAVERTNMEATLSALADGGWDIVINGESFDIGPFITELERSDPKGQPSTLGNTPLAITVDLDTVWIDPKHPLKKVSGTIVRDNDVWNLVQVEGRVGAGSPLVLAITGGKGASRTLKVTSSDAGGTLRSLGVFENMVGGKLRINGSFDDTVPGSPLTGTVKVTDYRIANAPGMAKLLSIMALTGILGQLRGEGIGFSILSVPFTLHNDVLEIRDARASGTEIGMTAEGRVADNSINIRGTVVPFYAANSALGKIPIIGPIFSGGQKGGGLLAARYTMVGPMDDPDVTINPLSMLTPGFLRNLFDIFDPDSGASGTGEAPAREPEPEHP